MCSALVVWGQAILLGNTFPLTHTDILEFSDVRVIGIRWTLPSLKSRDDTHSTRLRHTHTKTTQPLSTHQAELYRLQMFLLGPNPARQGISAAVRAVSHIHSQLQLSFETSRLSTSLLQDGTGARAGLCIRDQLGNNNATEDYSTQRKSVLLTDCAAAICLI